VTPPAPPSNSAPAPRTRLLYVISDLAGGGAERTVSYQLAGIDRSRYEVGLCLWRDRRVNPVPDDVPVWIVEKHRPWHIPGAIVRTRRLIRRWRPDVVFSHMRFVSVLTGAAMLGLRRRPVWAGCFQNTCETDITEAEKRLYGRIFRSMDLAVGVSDGVCGSVSRAFGIPEERLFRLYNAVDPTRLGALRARPFGDRDPAGGTRRIITMGRLAKQKDHETLLESLARVLRDHDCRLQILGEGPLRPRLTHQAEALGIASRVDFLGYVDSPYALLAGADLYVTTSRWEGHPNALLEAMALGLPCVATDCPFGPSETIEHGRDGLLVPVGNPAAVAGAVARLLDDPEAARAMGREAARKIRERFSLGAHLAGLEELLGTLAARAA